MPSNIELERQLNELRAIISDLRAQVGEIAQHMGEFDNRLDDTTIKTLMAHRDISGLTSKLDDIRQDLKEIKKLGDAFVPRQEIDRRMDEEKHRLTSVSDDVKKLTHEIHSGQLTLTDRLHQNTIVTYGTLITILIAVVGYAISFIGKA